MTASPGVGGTKGIKIPHSSFQCWNILLQGCATFGKLASSWRGPKEFMRTKRPRGQPRCPQYSVLSPRSYASTNSISHPYCWSFWGKMIVQLVPNLLSLLFKSSLTLEYTSVISCQSPLQFLFRFFFLGSLRSVCIRLYARDRGGDCSLEEPLPTAKRNA